MLQKGTILARAKYRLVSTWYKSVQPELSAEVYIGMEDRMLYSTVHGTMYRIIRLKLSAHWSSL
jgi:hypothetical protein